MGTFSTSRVVRFTTHHCCDPGDYGHRTHHHCCQAPCGQRSHCSQEAGVMCAVLPVATGVSRASGSATVAKGQGCRHLLHCSLSSTPLCIPVHPSSEVDFWISPVLVCQAEEPLLSCEYFTSCRMQGRQRGCLIPHDADTTSNLVLKIIKLKPSFIG